MSTLKTNNIQHVDRSDPSIIISTDGGVSIAGTLTYEDVTSVDAVGIITAREILNAQKQVHVGTGVSIKAGGLNVTAGITTVQALQATTGTFSAAVSGTTGTFSGDVDIADKIIHTGDTDTAIRFPSANTVTVEAAGVQKLSLSTNEVVFNDTGIDCDFRVEGDNNANALKLDAGSDRVAIGLASPNAPLHVYHASTNGVATFESGDTIALINFKDNSTGSAYPALGAVGDDLKLLTGDAYRATIKSTGNFGIGTENPGLPLHIYHATSNGIILAESGDSNCGISLKDNGGEVSVRGIGNDLVLTTSSSETERLRITSSGDLGLGTASPSDNIHIAESGATNNYIRFSNSNISNGWSVGAQSGGRFQIVQNGVADRFFIESDGNVTVNSGNLIIGTSGKGIDFAATSDGTGTDSSELFDDYEEGSFTPYIDRENGSPIVGYDAQDGYYTKIGKVVYFYAEVRINSYNGNGSYGLTHLRGLPYQSATRDGGRGVWNSVTYHSYYRDMTTTDGEKDIAVVQHTSEKVVFYIQRSENSWATPPAPDANDQFKIGGFYFT